MPPPNISIVERARCPRTKSATNRARQLQRRAARRPKCRKRPCQIPFLAVIQRSAATKDLSSIAVRRAGHAYEGLVSDSHLNAISVKLYGRQMDHRHSYA